MESRAKILAHPIHQMLIPFPFGLLGTAVIFDIIYLIWGNPTMVTVSYWLIVAGIIGAIAAAPFGLVDWIGPRANGVDMMHGLANVSVLALFAFSWYLRYSAPDFTPYVPTITALVLSFAGFTMTSATGWYGGEPVDRLGVDVDNGASLDARSSATKKAADLRRAA